MAINVIVMRDEGNVPAPDIVDALVTTEEVAVSRGTQFIDANHRSKMLAAANSPFTQWIAPGSLLEITDSEFVAYKALVTDITLSISKNKAEYTMDANMMWETVANE
jgi:hypothetical protein